MFSQFLLNVLYTVTRNPPFKAWRKNVIGSFLEGTFFLIGGDVFAGVLGTNAVAVGADVSLETATENFIKYNAGLNITYADLVASLTLNKGESLSASYYHLVSPLSSTAIRAELTHSFSSNENVLTLGTQRECAHFGKKFKIARATPTCEQERRVVTTSSQPPQPTRSEPPHLEPIFVAQPSHLASPPTIGSRTGSVPASVSKRV